MSESAQQDDYTFSGVVTPDVIYDERDRGRKLYSRRPGRRYRIAPGFVVVMQDDTIYRVRAYARALRATEVSAPDDIVRVLCDEDEQPHPFVGRPGALRAALAGEDDARDLIEKSYDTVKVVCEPERSGDAWPDSDECSKSVLNQIELDFFLMYQIASLARTD